MANLFNSVQIDSQSAGDLVFQKGPHQARVILFAVAVALCFLLDVASEIDGVPVFFKYLALFFGLVPIVFYLALYPPKIIIGIVELVFLTVLTALVPIAIFNEQALTDVLGNFIRYLFLLLAVTFWRSQSFDLNLMLADLFSILFKVAVICSVVLAGLQILDYIPRSQQHAPFLIFLFAFAMHKRRVGAIAAVIVMAVLTGKDSLYISICAMLGIELIIRRVWWAGILIFLFGSAYAVFGTNPVLFTLDLIGSNFRRLGMFLSSFEISNFSEKEINSITSNRYFEYRSIVYDWQDHGIPFLGRGLGATVAVEIAHINQFVDRSTLHNSFLVVFQTLGLFGLAVLWRFFIRPLFLVSKVSNTLFIGQIGILTYALTSNTLLTDPTLQLISALSFVLALDRRKVFEPVKHKVLS